MNVFTFFRKSSYKKVFDFTHHAQGRFLFFFFVDHKLVLSQSLFSAIIPKIHLGFIEGARVMLTF